MARDSRGLFQALSQKMRADFDLTANINHAGSKGVARENALKDFLGEGRLPKKYGVGTGEIFGHAGEVSPQYDLIIYDQMEGVRFITDPNTQIYPIESVYGIVEVKSALSKAELLDGLEKIKAVKLMKPMGAVVKSIGGGWHSRHPRPRPFGTIFAYGLARNSLESLLGNLREWEAANPREVWPNYICVLEEGAIYHQGKPFEAHLANESFDTETWPTSFPWKEDTLFKFYIALLDLCSGMSLGPVEMSWYFRPGTKIGKYFVEGHVEFTRAPIGDKASGKIVRLTEGALDKIVGYGETHGSIKYEAYLLGRLGKLPMGMEGSRRLKQDIHLFFPSEEAAIMEIAAKLTEDIPPIEKLALLGNLLLHEIAINGKAYAISFRDLDESDYEVLD